MEGLSARDDEVVPTADRGPRRRFDPGAPQFLARPDRACDQRPPVGRIVADVIDDVPEDEHGEATTGGGTPQFRTVLPVECEQLVAVGDEHPSVAGDRFDVRKSGRELPQHLNPVMWCVPVAVPAGVRGVEPERGPSAVTAADMGGRVGVLARIARADSLFELPAQPARPPTAPAPATARKPRREYISSKYSIDDDILCGIPPHGWGPNATEPADM